MPWDQVPAKWKAGTLKSGSGHPVKDKKQMVAILLSEKRKAHGGTAEYQSKDPLTKAFGKVGSKSY